MSHTEDRFLGGRVVLRQPARGFRSGSDAVLLAAACPAQAGEAVLDLGCGAGAAMACVAARVPGVVVAGLERDAGAAALARANVPGARVIEGDALDPPPAAKRQWDHVICNPPYLPAGSGRAAADAAREAALREAGPGGVRAWTRAAMRRAGPKGTVTLVARADRLADLLGTMAPGLGDLAVLPLASQPGAPAHRVIVRGRKAARGPLRLLPPLVLHDGAVPSAAAEAVLRHAGPLTLS
ncbi:methyltransferase [Jannaschia sp. Os4]|uniref:methyltransferase n=1 Tax=Jannaschia sp. Os4 TaxID=2807617 RepID=UPI00193AAD42|nr:methyltransferase [Jannaschia sp. Os4]MBM2577238.1 methyltransferase [Jannaschia sp. Os4]